MRVKVSSGLSYVIVNIVPTEEYIERQVRNIECGMKPKLQPLVKQSEDHKKLGNWKANR